MLVTRGRSLLLVAVLAVFLVASVPAMGSAKGVGGELAPQTAFFYEDMYEPDDTFEDAYLYDPEVDGNTFTSWRTFHGTNGEADDEYDIVAVSVEMTDTPIWVETIFIDGPYDPQIYVYDEEENYLTYEDDHDYFDTYSSSIYFRAPEPGLYYFRIDNRDMPCEYELHITVGNARRVWGENRYDTAAAVSNLMWDNTQNPYYGYGYGPEHIVIANGRNPADALAGGALAAQLDGVLLLTERDYLPWETWWEIQRVTESLFWDQDDVTVHVLGGTSVVSDDVVEQLGMIRHVTAVNRIAGADRYETAVEIADATVSDGWFVGTTAFVVNGFAWADALAVAPVAAYNGSVVLMTRTNTVPQVTLDWLSDNGITDVVIVGGEVVVSEAVFDELDALYGVTRVSGDDRYETARDIALWGVDNAGMDGDLAILVSGQTFADALAAAPLSWWTGAPVLLTRKASLSSTVADYFDVSGAIGDADTMGCYVLGGPGAISDATYEAFRDHWKVLLP